jgi:hypothetical protein
VSAMDVGLIGTGRFVACPDELEQNRAKWERVKAGIQDPFVVIQWKSFVNN